jgi:hypothetical protein
MSGVFLNFLRKDKPSGESKKVFFYTFAAFILGSVVQWIEYLPAVRQGSFLDFLRIQVL